MPPLVVTCKRTRKQIEFITAKQRFVLNSGGFGSGKSLALCDKLYMRASRPGAREAVVRKTLKALKATTLKTLLDGDGKTPPVIPPGTYSYNKTDHVIKIKGGGEIVGLGMDDPTNVGSHNLTGANISEATQLTYQDFTWLNGRVRVPLDGFPLQLNMECNPAVPSHWLAKLFGLALDYKPHPDSFAIRSRTDENPTLPPDYVENLRRTLTGVAFKRFFEGQWCGSDGLVYDTWDRDKHVRILSPGGYCRAVVGADEGYQNPFTLTLVLVDSDGRAYALSEVHQSRLQLSEKVEAIRRMMTDSPVPVEAVLVDPSAPDLIDEFRRANVPVYPANNEVEAGIKRVQQRLADPGDGRPRMAVHPDCENLVREFESYEWRVDRATGTRKDEVDKHNDHQLDGLRYAISYLDADSGEFRLVTGQPPPRSADDPMEGVSINFQELRAADINFGFE